MSKNTAAKEIKEIPKWIANTKSDWGHITAAAPIKPWSTRKNVDKKAKSFISPTCSKNFQARMATTMTEIPTTVETSLWLYSIINSGVTFEGKSCPLHKGQLEPHPSPESVFVTRAPPIKINNMPMVE